LPLIKNIKVNGNYLLIEARNTEMNRKLFFTTNILILTTIAFVSIISDIGAKNYTYKQVNASDPWARATSKLAKTGAVYIKNIHNKGKNAVKITGFSANIAKKVQLHNTVVKNEVAKMQHIEFLEIGPNKSVQFNPGGLHIMLMGLKRPLEKNSHFPLIIKFEKLGNLEIMVNIKNIGWSQKKPSNYKHVHH